MKEKRIVRDCVIFLIGTVWFLLKVVVLPFTLVAILITLLVEWLDEDPDYGWWLRNIDDLFVFMPFGQKMFDYLKDKL